MLTRLYSTPTNFTRAFLTFSFSESVFITGSQPKALAATSDNTVFVVGVDSVEAVRNNQKVAELRSGGGASSASSGASATAIAAAGSLIAIGSGVGWQQSSPCMPGCLLTRPARLPLLSYSSIINDMNSYRFFFFYTGSEGSAVQLGRKVVPGSRDFGS